jgi:hypothetical protein
MARPCLFGHFDYSRELGSLALQTEELAGEYEQHLKDLVCQLSESLPTVRKRVVVPELPPG